MSLIARYHWALTKPRYDKGVLTGIYNDTWPNNLTIEPIENPTIADLSPMMDKLSEKWEWNAQGRYNEQALIEKLTHPDTRLYQLIDLAEDEPVVGYALVSTPPADKIKRFWTGANDTRVLEIDNLGLFPGNEGSGRGKAFFEQIFKEHFADYDVIYWSQHDTHSPTLKRFYQNRLQMELLATDHVPDFRSSEPKVA